MAREIADDDESDTEDTDSNAGQTNQRDINNGENSTSPVARRSFLKLAGTATAGLLGANMSQTAAAADISFDRVVDAVEDLGMDNTGSQSIDGQLDDALQSGTLIEFPAGKYRIGQRHSLEGLDRVGLRGTGSGRRDVQFVPPQGGHVRMFDGGQSGSGAVLFENLCFHDLSDDSTIVSINIRTSGGSVVRNVEWLGRTPSAAQDTGIHYQFGAQVLSRDGVLLLEDIHAGVDEPSVPVQYPDGVSFIYAGPSHSGETILRNPVIKERNSNATRATNISGVLTIEGGKFINNQNSNIRFSAGDHPSKVSSATGTYIKIDGSRDASEAIRVDASSNGYAGSVYRDLTIDWSKENTRGVIAAPDFSGHGRAEFYNCTIRNDGSPDRAPTVAADPVSETDDDAIIIENCSFTGSGGGFTADGRDGSVIRDSCISMPNASIQGFDTEGVSSSGCETPSGSEDTSDDSESDLPNTLSVRGTGTATNYSFSVSDSVEGRNNSLESHDAIKNGDTVEAWVTNASHVDEFAYSGEVTAFEYLSGGPVEITRNGDPVSPEELGAQNEQPSPSITVEQTEGLSVDLSAVDSSDSDGEIAAYRWNLGESTATGESISHTFESPGTYTVALTVEDNDGATTTTTTDMTVTYRNQLRIQGTGTTTEYAVEVSDALAPVEETIEEWDSVSQTSAQGWVTTTSDVDEFTFTGELTRVEFLEGDADVYVNGELVEPTDGSSSQSLRIQGTGTATEYAVEVSDELTPVEETIEEWDSVSQTSAQGWVTTTSDVDEFTFTGELTRVEFLEGDADVYVDGEAIDPASV